MAKEGTMVGSIMFLLSKKESITAERELSDEREKKELEQDWYGGQSQREGRGERGFL